MPDDDWWDNLTREIAEGKRCGERLGLIECANLNPCPVHMLPSRLVVTQQAKVEAKKDA